LIKAGLTPDRYHGHGSTCRRQGAHTALDLIRGIAKYSAYPPNPKTAVPN
jgi:hypothetical protein